MIVSVPDQYQASIRPVSDQYQTSIEAVYPHYLYANKRNLPMILGRLC